MLKRLISGGITVSVITILQVITLFTVQVTLARILEPSEFGVFAFISLVAMFLNSFGSLHGDKFLIKEKKNPYKILDTIFTVELIWGLLLILFSLFLLPTILAWIDKSHLTEYIQIFCIVLLYNPLVKPKALFEKELSFVKANMPMLVSHVVGGIVGITLAYNNYGIWSLVWWKVTISLVESVLIWFILPYRPKLRIDYKIFRESMVFGYPLLISTILVFISTNIDYYLVDLLIDEKSLGFYWMAFQISHYLFFIRAAINKVLFPTLAKLDNLKDQIKLFDMITVITAIIYFIPVFIILLFSQEIILFVYGEKWLPSSLLLQIFIVVVLIKAVSSNVAPLLHTYGYTKVDMEVAIINLLALIPLLYFLTDLYGTTGAAAAVFIVGNISVFYTYQVYVKKLIHKGYLSYFTKILFLLFFTGLLLWGANNLFTLSLIHKLLLLIVLFIMLYITYLKDIQIILNEYQNSESSSNLNILSNNSSNQRKMNFIIYSGSHNVNLLGATKSTDIMLVKNLKKLGYNIVWVGRGEVDISICKYHNIGTNKIFEFAIRGYNKFKRIVFSTSVNQQLLDEFIYYDKKLTNLIQQNIIEVNSDTIIIGRNGMSLYSFEEVKKRGGKAILHSQWMHPNVQKDYLEKEYKRIGLKNEPILAERIQRQLAEIKIVDKIWCISSLVEKSYLVNNIKKEKLINCALGVDFQKYDSLDKRKNNKEFNILFVGNVNPEKGVHLLLKAMLNINSSDKINLIFNGHITQYFEDIFNEYKDKLMEKGISVLVESGSPLKNYSQASLFVLPSIHESFGLVVLEAMASGLPVIVSNNVGSKDCIQDQVNGVIFERNNDRELTSVIQNLIDNKDLIKQMGKQSSKIAKDYDWSCIASDLVVNIDKSNL